MRLIFYQPELFQEPYLCTDLGLPTVADAAMGKSWGIGHTGQKLATTTEYSFCSCGKSQRIEVGDRVTRCWHCGVQSFVTIRHSTDGRE
jgi:hypothetical protein